MCDTVDHRRAGADAPCYHDRMSETVADPEGCIRRVLLAIMIADDDVDPDEIETLRSVYQKITGQGVTAEALQDEALQMKAAGVTLATCVGPLAYGLDDRAKERVLAAAFAVATADGFVLDEEDEMLASVARALGMQDVEYQSAIHDLMARHGAV
jgi:tellurite resistance protein